MCLSWWNDRRSCMKVRGYVCLLVCCLPSCCRHYSLLPCRFVLVTIAQLNAHNLVGTHTASYASSSSHWPYSRWVWWRTLGTCTVLHSHLYSEVFFSISENVSLLHYFLFVSVCISPCCLNLFTIIYASPGTGGIHMWFEVISRQLSTKGYFLIGLITCVLWTPQVCVKTQWCMLNQITLECVVNTRFSGREDSRKIWPFVQRT